MTMRKNLQAGGNTKQLRKAVKPKNDLHVDMPAMRENAGYNPYDNPGVKMTVDIDDTTARNRMLRGGNRSG